MWAEKVAEREICFSPLTGTNSITGCGTWKREWLSQWVQHIKDSEQVWFSFPCCLHTLLWWLSLCRRGECFQSSIFPPDNHMLVILQCCSTILSRSPWGWRWTLKSRYFRILDVSLGNYRPTPGGSIAGSRVSWGDVRPRKWQCERARWLVLLHAG